MKPNQLASVEKHEKKRRLARPCRGASKFSLAHPFFSISFLLLHLPPLLTHPPPSPPHPTPQKNISRPPDVLQEEDGSVTVRDDLEPLLLALPEDIRATVANHPRRASLLEVVLDLGRRPETRFLGSADGEGSDGATPASSSSSSSPPSSSSSPSPAATAGREFLREAEVTAEDLAAAERAVGEFGGDNRAGVQGTLHRISAIRNRRGTVIGLTCRVGRAVTGHISLIRDILDVPNSILFLGRPGVGKTTVIREMARVLADELHKRVVIVDTSNEIGGDGDVPHPAIGGARRMQVPDPGKEKSVPPLSPPRGRTAEVKDRQGGGNTHSTPLPSPLSLFLPPVPPKKLKNEKQQACSTA